MRFVELLCYVTALLISGATPSPLQPRYGHLATLDLHKYPIYTKREFIAGAENGPEYLGLNSQQYDPSQELANRRKSFAQLPSQSHLSDSSGDIGREWKSAGTTWTQNPLGQWNKGRKWMDISDPTPSKPSREETIKELPGLITGTKGSNRFEKAWESSEPGRLVTYKQKEPPRPGQRGDKKFSYEKTMPGPDALSDQALRNYGRKMFEDGNKQGLKQGMPESAGMAAAGFSQKAGVVDWARDHNGEYFQTPQGNVHKDTESNIELSLSSKGRGNPPLSREYQLAVDRESAIQLQQTMKAKTTEAEKIGGAVRTKDRWRKDESTGEKTPPKRLGCEHAKNGNCAEKGTLPKANKDQAGNPVVGSVSTAYGNAGARPGFRPELMNNVRPDKQGILLSGSHPGCSAEAPKIGCDKVLEHNKVKDLNSANPEAQDAKFTIPKGNTANKAAELLAKMQNSPKPNANPAFQGRPEIKGQPNTVRNPPIQPWELPKRVKDMSDQEKIADTAHRARKEEAIKQTAELAQAREKKQQLPDPQTQAQKNAEAERLIKQSREARAKDEAAVRPLREAAQREAMNKKQGKPALQKAQSPAKIEQEVLSSQKDKANTIAVGERVKQNSESKQEAKKPGAEKHPPMFSNTFKPAAKTEETSSKGLTIASVAATPQRKSLATPASNTRTKKTKRDSLTLLPKREILMIKIKILEDIVQRRDAVEDFVWA